MPRLRILTNNQVAELLRNVAAALELSSANNQFRITAYQRAADAVEHASSEVKDIWDENQLKDIPGIGESIASHLDELFRTGKSKHFQSIMENYPPAFYELLKITGIGPKTAFRLCKALGLNKAHKAISGLEKAALRGHIASLEGFGEDSQSAILKSIAEYRNKSNRLLLTQASFISDSIISWMKKNSQVIDIDPLGSLRRRVSTVGDIDISVSTASADAVINHFCHYPKITRVLESGEFKASIVVSGDIQVDLMVQPPESYGSLLQHFTGSKHHNIALREYALKKGFSLSEYGIKFGDHLKKFSDEKSFYKFLGLDWIPPELREDRGEIEIARSHRIPQLVKLENIKGDLQIHSSFDIEPSHDLGTSPLTRLAEVAAALQYDYIGITEHNPSVSAHSLSQILDLLKSKQELVKNFNSDKPSVRIFNGLEIDIQSDGKRALPDQGMEFLDYACVSIHGAFHQNRQTMTKRIISGLDHPKVRFLAHPTARLLNEREGIEIDWDKLFDFCLKNDKWLEVDAWPNRLDLPDNLIHEAVKNQVKIIINTDSHDADHLQYMKYGVDQARRGWATSSDIINTTSLENISRILKGGD